MKNLFSINIPIYKCRKLIEADNILVNIKSIYIQYTVCISKKNIQKKYNNKSKREEKKLNEKKKL